MSTPEPPPDLGRVERILDRLIEQSDEGAIEWETGGPPDSYAANVGAFRLRLRSQSGTGEPPFLFELSGSIGQLVVSTEGPEHPAVAQKIMALYTRGRRAALDPNKVLRSIEQELGLDSPNP
jgi:hypothetical protein